MKFQIVEFNDARVNKKYFAIRMGVIAKEHWFLCFNKRVIKWEWEREHPEAAATQFNSFNDAMEIVNELKKQIPIYYNVK